MYDCVIAGAGPAGCRLARVLSGKGLSVLVLEEHHEIGVPVHCTGIVGSGLLDEFQLDPSVLLGRIDKVMVNFPDGRQVRLPTSIRPLLVDRRHLDLQLSRQALDEGARIINGARVESIVSRQDHALVSYRLGGELFQAVGKVVVLATGSMSPLPKMCGISPAPAYYQSVQTEARLKGIDGIELFLGDRIAPGSFAYAVGFNGGPARIGLITRRRSREHMNRLLMESSLASRLEHNPGPFCHRPMPFGVPEKTVAGRVVAVGDAACQLKSTTGGGVYFSLTCADLLGKVIVDSRRNGNFDLDMLGSYDRLWKGRLRMELKAGLALRRFLEGVGDAWWNRVGRALEEPEISRIIRDYQEFDNHHRFIIEFFKNPVARRLVLEGFALNMPGLGWITGHRNGDKQV